MPTENVPANASLAELRRRIDEIDASLLCLLNERAKIAQEVAVIKRRQRLPYYVPQREEQVIARLRELNGDRTLSNVAMESIFREIISACRSLEVDVHVAYLGPEASFTHIASRRRFGSEAVYVPQPNQAEIFRHVEMGACHYGVVPIENSTHGVVIESLDLFARTQLQILGEILLPVAHNLLSNGPMEEIKRVYSHRQALSQCQEWLGRNLPHAEKMELSSTSEAARRAAHEPGSAAIASELAAETHGIRLLHAHIEDSADNTTRFLIIGDGQAEPTGNDKTSLLFTVRNEVGALVRVLERFSKYRIDLSNIISRPSRIRSWEYVFFADIAGHLQDPPLRAALAELETVCLYIKVLGSYPCG